MDEEYMSPASRRAGRDAPSDQRRAAPRVASASDAELRALELAASAVEGVRAVQADLSEIKEMLGRAPSPGHEGTGLIGAVSEMQASLARLDAPAERKAPPKARQVARAPLVIALIAALGGSAGIAGIVEAVRGRAEAAPQQQTTEH
ncbi:hypothetical protein [Sorangium sp. So ce693]|uniref:hypothetical protein n=1 Tax=Sorangium sp. So ce693 TaxID=3133318 RepID=UPI003F60EAB7